MTVDGSASDDGTVSDYQWHIAQGGTLVHADTKARDESVRANVLAHLLTMGAIVFDPGYLSRRAIPPWFYETFPFTRRHPAFLPLLFTAVFFAFFGVAILLTAGSPAGDQGMGLD
jgi:hypothetical protein